MGDGVTGGTAMGRGVTTGRGSAVGGLADGWAADGETDGLRTGGCGGLGPGGGAGGRAETYPGSALTPREKKSATKVFRAGDIPAPVRDEVPAEK